MVGRVVGRDDELRGLDTFLASVARGSAALVVEGEPGIGKSTLWDAGVERAAERGFLVLACRPASSETRLTFVGLADLLSGLEENALDVLRPPQLCHAVISVNTQYGTMKNKRFLAPTSVPAGAWKKVIDATLAGQSKFIAATPAAILTAVKHEVAWFAKVRANHYLLSTSPAPMTVADVRKISAFEKTQCGISFAS